jgi:hypothetical protein
VIGFGGGVVLILHGLLHLGVWTVKPDPALVPSFDASRSWVLARSGRAPSTTAGASVGLAVACAVAFAASGWLALLDMSLWRAPAVLGCILGLVLKVVWFNRWLVAGIAIDIVLLAVSVP